MRTMTLLVAAVMLGLMAGLFWSYAGSVLPALRGVDDRAAVEVMQRINVAIVTPFFVLVLFGALGFTAVAAALFRHRPAVLIPLVVALALYAATLLVTVTLNIPLNDRLAQAGPPAALADPAAVWAEFSGPWIRWNTLRTLTSVGAFVAAAWALLESGRP